MPTAVSFHMWLITDKGTVIRVQANFGGMGFKKNVSCTTDFTKVRNIWFMAEPKFIRGMVINRRGRGQGGKVGSSRNKTVPERRRGVKCNRHRVGFVH